MFEYCDRLSCMVRHSDRGKYRAQQIKPLASSSAFTIKHEATLLLFIVMKIQLTYSH